MLAATFDSHYWASGIPERDSTMTATRRRFLQAVAGSAPLGLVDVSWLRSLAAIGAEPPPDRVQFGSELEPIVRLIEETPRERCVEVFIDQLRRRLPYRRFLAAALFVCVRKQHSHQIGRAHV